MLNRYPLWKYILVVVVAIVGTIYALPNLYGEDPSIQISALRGGRVDEALQKRVLDALGASLNMQAANYTDFVQAHASVGQMLMALRVAAADNGSAVSPSPSA